MHVACRKYLHYGHRWSWQSPCFKSFCFSQFPQFSLFHFQFFCRHGLYVELVAWCWWCLGMLSVRVFLPTWAGDSLFLCLASSPLKNRSRRLSDEGGWKTIEERLRNQHLVRLETSNLEEHELWNRSHVRRCFGWLRIGVLMVLSFGSALPCTMVVFWERARQRNGVEWERNGFLI